jgi:putative MFS transporter
VTSPQISARIDRLGRWPYPPSVLLLVGINFFFAYFDIANIGNALPKAIESFGASKAAAATVVSLGLWGYIIGGLINSVIADRYGRRVGFLLAAVLYGVGSLVNGLSPNIGVFTVARLVSGMGIGAALGVISTYMSEMSPAAGRGRYMARTTLPALFGYALVPILSVVLIPRFEWGWRAILIVPVLGTVVFLLGYRSLPESPRWLVVHGKVEQAEDVVRAAERRVGESTGTTLPPVGYAEPIAGDQASRDITIVFRRRVLPWTVLFFVIWLLNYLPVYAVVGLGVTLLTDHGFTLAKSLQLTLGSSLGIVLGGLFATWIADRVPRKYPAAAASLLLAVCLVALGLYPSNPIVILTYFLLAFQIGIFAPLMYLLTAEHFPTAGRTTGVALCNGVGHVGGAIGPFIVVAVVEAFGFSGTWIFLGILFLLLAAATMAAKNTTGVSLESVTSTPALPRTSTTATAIPEGAEQ